MTLNEKLHTPCDLAWNGVVMGARRTLRVALGNEHKFGSPIEEAFAVALQIQVSNEPYAIDGIVFLPPRTIDPRDRAPLATTQNGFPVFCVVVPQAQIGDHRVDFAVQYLADGDRLAWLVIECDGHEFHEKTKEQVARDKRRDRDLQHDGCKVFRYSGSEIWKDPYDCAIDVMTFMINESLGTVEDISA